MTIGVLASMLAGALWGLTFVAPLLAAPYSAFDLTVGRFLVYGIASVAILAASGGLARLPRLGRREWLLLTALGFAGNVGYYLVTALAVPRAGTAVVALTVGCLPVVMSLIGNRGSLRLPTHRLLPPLGLIAIGLLIVNGAAIGEAERGGSLPQFLLGVALTLAALALWTWYGLRNARALAEYPGVSSASWTALTGLGTLVSLLPVLLIGALSGWSAVPSHGLGGREAGMLLFLSLTLGLLSSWAATWAWSIATRRLSVSLASQLIVFETIFALLYGAVYLGRPLSVSEMIGATLLIAGVIAALRAFSRRQPTPPIAA